MLTAQQASARSHENKIKKMRKQREDIETYINRAVSEGLFSVQIPKQIDSTDSFVEIAPENKTYFSNLGYGVGDINEFINITWFSL